MPTVSDNPRRCSECRSHNTEPNGFEINEWDFYYRSWKCNKCGHKWDVGQLKDPPRNSVQDPIIAITEALI